ncbi:MAG: PKD domain-containing protein, partial [Bacteroidota bacterium]
TAINPVYSFSDTGPYVVRLIAEPNGACTDTFERQISLRESSLTAGFDFNIDSCADTAVVQANDVSLDTESPVVEWLWVLLEDGVLIESSTEQNPAFVIRKSDAFSLELTATAGNGCQETIRQDFEVQVIEERIEADTLELCAGDSILINSVAFQQYVYAWSPATGLSATDVASPVAAPLVSTDYSVQIRDTTTGCVLNDAVFVKVPEVIQLSLNTPPQSCDANIVIDAVSNVPGTYSWSDGSILLGDADSLLVSPIGSAVYYLQFEDAFGCQRSDSIEVTSLAVDAELNADSLLCLGQAAMVQIDNLDAGDNLTFSWAANPDLVSGANTANPVFQIDGAGPKVYPVRVENQFGCILLDTVRLFVLDTAAQADFIETQQCAGFTVNFQNTGINADFYQWNFGDPQQPDAGSSAANPSYSYPAAGTYLVQLSLNADVPCSDTIYKTSVVGAPQIELDFDWQLLNCSDTADVQFTNLSTNDQSSFTSFNWQFSNGVSSTLDNPLIGVEGRQTLRATLTATSDDGCVDSTVVNIPINAIELQLQDT